jgi:hypothetical protein
MTLGAWSAWLLNGRAGRKKLVSNCGTRLWAISIKEERDEANRNEGQAFDLRIIPLTTRQTRPQSSENPTNRPHARLTAAVAMVRHETLADLKARRAATDRAPRPTDGRSRPAEVSSED